MNPLSDEDLINPYDENGNLNELGKTLFDNGVKILMSKKKLAAVILSGGEGTRLGLDYPKGLFEIEGATLLDWHIKRLEYLNKKYGTEIYLFVMTSDATDAKIREFFSKNKHPFLKDVEIFKQNVIEALDIKTNNKIMRNGKAVMNPMGNGDFFDAIMKTKNVESAEVFNVISVDNVLAKILDEVYVGAFYDRNLEVLSKAVRALENESVGAFFKEKNKIVVKEYSESKSQQKNVYGNICNHLFTQDFIKKVAKAEMPLHKAYKKIPYTDEQGREIKPTEPNGIKREKFIFDSFFYSTRNAVMSVPRELEFSPLKNSNESKTDNPKTCAEAIRKHRINSDF